MGRLLEEQNKQLHELNIELQKALENNKTIAEEADESDELSEIWDIADGVLK